MEFNCLDLLVAFAGGIFGAAIGAFPVWILCGLAVLLGAISNITGDSGEIMNMVAWGHFIGPQTAFVGGVAAAAYAAKKKYIGSGRDIVTALVGLDKPMVLAVGGIFGALGYLMLWAVMLVPNYNELPWTNTIAMVVILNMVVARYVFGSTGLFGNKGDGECRWVPTEAASWLKYQSTPEQLVMLSIAVGLPASYYATVLPNSIGLVFGFVNVLLLFMVIGYNVPVTHHIALIASTVTVVTGSMAWGIAFGFMGAYLGEVAACLLLYRGDTHIDPPTTSLMITGTIFPACMALGMFDLPMAASYGIMAVIVVGGFFMLKRCKCTKK